MTVYGYARVSTDGQSLTSQDAELHAAGCAKVYAEKISGARSNRPKLAKVLKRLDTGDVPARPLGTLNAGLAQYPR
jgi:DNA invertase Pin-like site-specific DNA recombinase